MAKISLNKAFIPLDIELDDEIIHAKINVQEKQLFANLKKLEQGKDKFLNLASRLDEIKAELGEQILGSEEANALAQQMAETIKSAIVPFISESTYHEILVKCGDGEEVAPEDINFIMADILMEIMRLITERMNQANKRTTKAAHYLTELNNARTNTDTE